MKTRYEPTEGTGTTTVLVGSYSDCVEAHDARLTRKGDLKVVRPTSCPGGTHEFVILSAPGELRDLRDENAELREIIENLTAGRVADARRS